MGPENPYTNSLTNNIMSDPFLAEIVMFGGNFAPRGWALCDGQLLAISQYSAVFSLLGTTYGGDGRTTFGLPDLRGRSPVHAGNGPGLPQVRLGAKGGSTAFNIATANLPVHAHGLTNANIKLKVNSGNANNGDESTPVGHFIGGDTSDRFYSSSNGVGAGPALQGNTDNAGTGQALNHRSPYTSVNFIIALQGTFPSRN